MANRRCWLIILALALAIGPISAPGANADPGQSFWSIYVGNYWNYNGTDGYSSWTTHDEFVSTETVSQHSTYKLQKTGGQFTEYEWYEVTLPEIKIWKKTYWDDDIPGYVTVTLDAGLSVGKNPIVVGASWSNSSNGTGTVGSDSYPGTVSLSVNVLASESVTTPLGTYTAYKVQHSYSVSAPTAPPSGYYRTLTEQKWFIPSLGVVKWYDPNLLETELITSMNVKKWKVGFDGDGKTDILWRDTASGTVAIWLMNGTAISSPGVPGSIPTEWQIKGVGDFNGNGKTDILWRNTISGTVAIWLMNGTGVSSVGVPGSVPADWQIKGVGDFNGDGKPDILWQQPSSGTVAVWLMNGTAIYSVGVTGSIPADWQIKGVGDFDGDGKTDILLQHTGGWVVIWLMNGSVISSTGLPDWVPADWQIKGVGDFNADGKADILWQQPSSGTVAIWFMNGTAIASRGIPGSIPSTWQIKDVGDYNGDGKADILWQHTSGTVAIWLMNGTAIASTGVPGAVGGTWQIAN
jgi:hypothetical protein